MKTMILISTILMMVLSGCGPKAFVRGDYDDNVESDNLLTDRWSETDMQKVVNDLVASMMRHRAIRKAQRPPILMVTKLKNKTSEIIDTQSVMDMVKVELMRDGSVMFVDKEARKDIKAELDYQDSGMVSSESQKKKGGQIGADYIVNGRLDSIVQQAGKDKTVYYKVTLIMTNLNTGLMVWTDHKQIRKKYRKRSVGL